MQVVERGFSRINLFLGNLQGLNYVLPPTRFKPLWGVRTVTKFTSETSNRRVEKFFEGAAAAML